VRRDRSNADYPGVPIQFQSTRPREARHQEALSYISGILFQSTRPREARPALQDRAGGENPFQSTRPREARPRSIV